MAIKTEFDVTLEIDGQAFVLPAKEVSNKREKEISAMGDERAKLERERDALLTEINLDDSEHQANAVIMQGAKIKEKIELALEQKRLVKQVRQSRAWLDEINAKIDRLSGVYTEMYRLRFEEMVADGEAKTKLVRLTETTSLSYARLVVEIRKLINEAKEKN